MIEFEEKRSGNNTARISLEPESIAAVRDRDGRVVVNTIGGGEFILFVDYDELMEQLKLAHAVSGLTELLMRFGEVAEPKAEQDIEDPGDASPEDFVGAALALLEENEAAPDPAPLVPELSETESLRSETEENDGGS